MKTKTIALFLALASTVWADTKVSDRVALSNTDLAPSTDILPIVDVSAGAAGSKKITINNLFSGWGMTTDGKTLVTGSNFAAMRTSLGLVIGTNVQAWDSDLDAWATKTAPTGTTVGTSDTQTLTNKTWGTGTTITLGSDATGDLWYRGGGGGLTRLGIGSTGQVLTVASGLPSWAAPTGGGGGGSGDVVGPASATDNAIVRFDTTTGKLIQDSTVTLSDTGVLAGATLGSGTVFTSATMTLGSDATGDIYYRASGGGLTRLGAGSNGQVLTLASGLPSWATPSGGGLTNWTDAISSASPNNTITAASLSATGAASNIDAILRPKGTGAVMAQVPDNNTTGGSKRGTYAVDWQTLRTSASAVASGAASVVGGGSDNTSSNSYSVVAGGRVNSATNSSATVGGGWGNTASNTQATVAGGYFNTASGSDSTIAGGNSNTASGDYSWVPGGTAATTRGLYGMGARAAGKFSSLGDAQAGSYLLRIATGDATQTEMTLGAQSAGSTTRIVLPNSHVYSFRGRLVARSSAGDVAVWQIDGCVKRGANAAATAIVGSSTVTMAWNDSGASTWAVAVDADTTNGSLRFRVTGVAATTIHWVADIETVETS